MYSDRIVITGVGLTSPLGDDLNTYRKRLINGESGLTHTEIRYVGKVAVGLCQFDELRYQNRKNLRRGTRAGSIAIYCANEAVKDAKLDFNSVDKSRVGVYVGITEHGNVETENEIYNLKENNYDIKLWSHHHNPRTVANNAAGEVTLNMKITGPHYTIGSACAGGNAGVIQGLQMLLLDEVDYAICGGVSESPHTFGIFAAFMSQGALGSSENPRYAIRPMDKKRNGTVISEGGCLYVLEKLSRAKARGAKIYGEIVGHGLNSDASDFVLPLTERQIECMQLALKRAGISEKEIDLVSLHATGTGMGDISEAQAVKGLFAKTEKTYVNFTKGHIGHTMGAAGALELAGNLPSFEDGIVHPGIDVSELDPECEIPLMVLNEAKNAGNIKYILNNSFGMLGINSALIVKKYED